MLVLVDVSVVSLAEAVIGGGLGPTADRMDRCVLRSVERRAPAPTGPSRRHPVARWAGPPFRRAGTERDEHGRDADPSTLTRRSVRIRRTRAIAVVALAP